MPNRTVALNDDLEQGQAPLDDTPSEFVDEAPPTLAQWQAAIDNGRAELLSLHAETCSADTALAALKSLFVNGLDITAAALAHRLTAIAAMKQALPSSDTPLILFDCGFDVMADVHEEVAQALPMLVTALPGLEYVIRRPARRLSLTIYLPRVGSLTTNTWRGGEVQAEFVPGKSSDLRRQLMDEADEVELPEAIWINQNSCMSLSSVQDQPAPVKALTVQGRLLVITSTLTGPDVSQAEAWAMVDARQWQGQLTTNRERYASYEDGSRQRGDMRGLQVTLRGKVYVLAKPVLLADYRPYSVRSLERMDVRARGRDHSPANSEQTAGHEHPLKQLQLF